MKGSLLFKIAEARNFDVQWCAEYAEPGYHAQEPGIVFANWNNETRYDPETRERTTIDDTPERMSALFERLGFEIEWSDEWYTCDECYRAIRMSPDSYSWKPSFVIYDNGSIVCHECVRLRG